MFNTNTNAICIMKYSKTNRTNYEVQISKIIFINAPQHNISNNVVCATSKGSDQPAHSRSLIRAFVSRLNILHLEFLSLKGGCTGSSESTLVKMAHCWNSNVTAQICITCIGDSQGTKVGKMLTLAPERYTSGFGMAAKVVLWCF